MEKSDLAKRFPYNHQNRPGYKRCLLKCKGHHLMVFSCLVGRHKMMALLISCYKRLYRKYPSVASVSMIKRIVKRLALLICLIFLLCSIRLKLVMYSADASSRLYLVMACGNEAC